MQGPGAQQLIVQRMGEGESGEGGHKRLGPQAKKEKQRSRCRNNKRPFSKK